MSVFDGSILVIVRWIRCRDQAPSFFQQANARCDVPFPKFQNDQQEPDQDVILEIVV